MRQSYRILPVYTGDVSGVCSALYELGGMVVMHDPSGCNSTYNTHDEIRWYDSDSLIFLSGLRQEDAIMGGDDKLIGDITDAALVYHPLFIAICNSPIPYLNGTDFEGIAGEIEQNTGIPTFCVSSNGMYDYVRGAGLALEALARKLFGGKGCGSTEAASGNENNSLSAVETEENTQDRHSSKTGRSVNILGMTPLDYAAGSCTASVRSFAVEKGWQVQSVWAMGDSLTALQSAGEADLNLVVSSTGLAAAQYLYQRFGIPWVAGVPVGGFSDVLAQEMEEAVHAGRCGAAFPSERCGAQMENKANAMTYTAVIGEAVLSESIAAALRLRGEEAAVIVTAGTHEPALMSSLYAEKDSEDREKKICGEKGIGAKQIADDTWICLGEEETEEALGECARRSNALGAQLRVAADPLYELIAPAGARLIRIPQLAFSGRLYRKEFPDLMNKTTWRELWA